MGGFVKAGRAAGLQGTDRADGLPTGANRAGGLLPRCGDRGGRARCEVVSVIGVRGLWLPGTR